MSGTSSDASTCYTNWADKTVGTTGRLSRSLACCPRVVLCLVGLGLLIQVSHLWFPIEDAVLYASMARDIAGDSPGEEVPGGLTKGLPPVYPIILSVAYQTGPRPFLAMSVIHFVFGLLTTSGIWIWARRIVGRGAVFAVAVTMSSLAYGYVHRRTLKECVFLTLLVWSANFLNRWVDTRNSRQRIVFGLLAVALISLLVLVRYAGVAIVAGLVLSQWFRARTHDRSGMTSLHRNHAFSIGLVALPVLVLMSHAAYQISIDRVAHTGSYMRGFLSSLQTMHSPIQVLDTILLRVSDIGRLTIPGMFKSYGPPGEWWNIHTPIYGLWATGIGYGWWSLTRRSRDVLLWSLPPYLLVYIIWSEAQGARYLTPMLPVLTVSLWRFLRSVMRQSVKLRTLILRQPWSWEWSRRSVWASWTVLTGLAVAHSSVMIGNYFAVDRPRASKSALAWNEVETISHFVHSTPGPLLAAGIDDGEILMLRFESRQDVPKVDITDAPNHGLFPWVVHSVESALSADYVEWYRGEHLVLSRRIDAGGTKVTPVARVAMFQVPAEHRDAH